MKLYQYKAMDSAGGVRQGRLSASNLEDLEAHLGRMGLDLITGKPVRQGGLLLRRRNVTRRDLIDFCFQLEQLTGAGVTLLQGLDDLRSGMDNPRFREIVSSILDRIREGHTLSAALEAFPRVFDPVFTSLIRVGEQSGELPSVLKSLGEELRWQDELSARARKATLYPAFVAATVFGVVAFLMVYLVPQLVRFITGMEGELPLHTRALLATSEAFTAYWHLIFGLPAAAWGGVALAAGRRPAIRRRVDRLKLRTWLVGDIVRKIVLARLAKVFALMYRAGVPVLRTLEIIERVAGNAAIEHALADVRRRIGEGDSMSGSFAHSGLFPPLVLRMLSVGENSGALDGALLNIAYFYDRDVKERIDRLEAVIEPVLTVVLGAVLAWIMLSVLGPIYDLVAKVTA